MHCHCVLQAASLGSTTFKSVNTSNLILSEACLELELWWGLLVYLHHGTSGDAMAE